MEEDLFDKNPRDEERNEDGEGWKPSDVRGGPVAVVAGAIALAGLASIAASLLLVTLGVQETISGDFSVEINSEAEVFSGLAGLLFSLLQLFAGLALLLVRVARVALKAVGDSQDWGADKDENETLHFVNFDKIEKH